MTEEQIRKAIEEQTGIKLYRTPYTGVLVIDSGVSGSDARPYTLKLYGPYGETGDLRVFVSCRYLGDSHTAQLLVQDKDDDIFLNSTAEGAERYNVGMIHLTTHGQTLYS